MIVDRYPPIDLFALAPDLGLGFDPVLRELDRRLEDEAILRCPATIKVRTERQSG